MKSSPRDSGLLRCLSDRSEDIRTGCKRFKTTHGTCFRIKPELIPCQKQISRELSDVQAKALDPSQRAAKDNQCNAQSLPTLFNA